MAEKKAKKDQTENQGEETQLETAETGEQPVGEAEPVAESGAEAEEPVAEEPAEEPAAEPVAEAEEPVAEELPEPVAEAEEPAAEEPAPDEPVAEAEEAPAEEAEAAPAAAATEPAGKPKRKRLPRSQRRQRTRPKRERPKERKPIVRAPKPEHERGRRQERRGVVVSSAMDKTIVVKVDSVKAHPRYKKIVRRSTKFHAHDEQNEAKVGDLVRIVETRPLSKTKMWRLVEVMEAAR
jgi:small subunit ribosomal protein S17